MEKKTIGGFISALRKSNGLTQQEMADKLNVSNKTVSKWERDESCPDIGLIPAIAELYGVTCDEILLGERLASGDPPQAKAPKIEKQLKRLAGSTLTRFKNNALVSILLAVSGLILLYSVSYAFFAPVIGFGLCLICLAASVILAATQFNTANNILHDDLDEGENPVISAARVGICRWFFAALSLNLFAFFLALPLIIFRDDTFVNSVITFSSYLACLPVVILITLLAVFCLFYSMRGKLDMAHGSAWLFYRAALGGKMNLVQGGLMTGGILIIIISMMLEASYGINLAPPFLILSVLGFFICSIVAAFRYAGKEPARHDWNLLMAAGVRNFLFGVSAYGALVGQGRSYLMEGGQYIFISFHLNWREIFVAFLLAATALALFLFVKYRVVKGIETQ
ncbi:MAG: helix-turn-helix transcriptional regulator [Clostridiales bacterium]|nr:helix-turn-helix transcriptional regulator [Clostridiales bacterium]